MAHAAAKSTAAALANSAASQRAKTTAPPERVIEARYIRTAQMFLRFADGFKGTWSFSQLGLDMANMKLTSIKASTTGTSVNVQSKWGDKVQLDPSSLRALVDPAYAAAIERRLDALASKIGL